jgi:hypothetical protein
MAGLFWRYGATGGGGVMTETPFDKALARLTDFGDSEYRRGYRDGLKIAQQIVTWFGAINPESDATWEDIEMWSKNLLAKADGVIKCE